MESEYGPVIPGEVSGWPGPSRTAGLVVVCDVTRSWPGGAGGLGRGRGRRSRVEAAPAGTGGPTQETSTAWRWFCLRFSFPVWVDTNLEISYQLFCILLKFFILKFMFYSLFFCQNHCFL